MSIYLFFFFKQKTAYEMRISDWSSDVCSSDLPLPRPEGKWRIQLGAFSNEANARRLWGRLQPRVSTLGSRQSYFVKAGSIVRLQAGPFASSSEAASACAAVKAKGKDRKSTRLNSSH